MSERIGIKQAIFGVSGIVIISKLLGFVREMVIAERFGTSLEYDIFLIAIAAPIFLNVVIVRSANFLTVPLLTRKLNEPSYDGSRREIWSLFNSFVIIVLGLTLAVMVAAPYLVKLIGSNMQGESLRRGILYCRFISLMLMLGFFESFLRSALNVKKHFIYPAIGTVILNVVIIAAIYLFSRTLSVASILAGMLVGSFVQVLFLAVRLFKIRLFRFFNLAVFTPEVRTAVGVGGIIVGVELMTSGYFIIDRYFASDMIEGVVSALNYCSLVTLLPVNIFGFAVAAVTFPYLSERSEAGQKKDFSSLLYSALSLAMVVGLPCGVFYLAFPKELIAAVFWRGAFDLTSLGITSNILIYLAPFLVSLFVYNILVQSCYSAGFQRQVFFLIIFATALKIIMTAILKSIYDYPGIAMASSITLCFTVSGLAFYLWKRSWLENLRGLAILMLKLILASAPMILVAWYLRSLPDFSQDMGIISRFRVIPAGMISMLFFLAIGYILRIDEIGSLILHVKDKLVKVT